MPSTSLNVQPSGTSEFVIPAYGFCLIASGATCRGSGDTAPGQTLRLNNVISGGLPDLNGDGRPEVIYANQFTTTSYIYWGQAGGVYGVQYNTSARTNLPTNSALEAAVGDLNGDGLPEVVFGNLSGTSHIYWGQRGGTFGVQHSASNRTDLPTPNAHGLAIRDLNADGRPELVFANRHGNSYFYWAQPGGPYGVQYSISDTLPTQGAVV